MFMRIVNFNADTCIQNKKLFNSNIKPFTHVMKSKLLRIKKTTICVIKTPSIYRRATWCFLPPIET